MPGGGGGIPPILPIFYQYLTRQFATGLRTFICGQLNGAALTHESRRSVQGTVINQFSDLDLGFGIGIGFWVSGIIIEYFCLTWHCEQQTLRHVFLLFNCFFVIKLIQFARICK